jgi:hypothetical protein
MATRDIGAVTPVERLPRVRTKTTRPTANASVAVAEPSE